MSSVPVPIERRQTARVDRAGLNSPTDAARVTVDPQVVAVPNVAHGVAHVDDGRQSVFPRHHRAVRQVAASLHHHGRGTEEQRGPARVGRRRHQHVALPRCRPTTRPGTPPCPRTPDGTRRRAWQGARSAASDGRSPDRSAGSWRRPRPCPISRSRATRRPVDCARAATGRSVGRRLGTSANSASARWRTSTA